MFEPDELAGIVDTFGALERAELERACSETAFRRGADLEDDVVDAAIEDAIDAYALVEHDGRLVPGPAAFPTLPDGAEDLPHILDAGRRDVDRDAVAATVVDRFEAELVAAIDAGDRERCERLIDRSYEIEAWGAVELDGVRDRIDDELDIDLDVDIDDGSGDEPDE
ncbi:hypothetical protein GCM10028857_01680 [Salinarchaeum chitinilyticum]